MRAGELWGMDERWGSHGTVTIQIEPPNKLNH